METWRKRMVDETKRTKLPILMYREEGGDFLPDHWLLDFDSSDGYPELLDMIKDPPADDILEMLFNASRKGKGKIAVRELETIKDDLQKQVDTYVKSMGKTCYMCDICGNSRTRVECLHCDREDLRSRLAAKDSQYLAALDRISAIFKLKEARE